MKKSLFIFFILIINIVFTQNIKTLYNKGINEYNNGNLESAIKFFKKSNNNGNAYLLTNYYLALCNISLNKFEDALKNIEDAMVIKYKQLELILLRAIVKKNLTLYESSKEDLNYLINKDYYNLEAHYNRALLFVYESKFDSACLDFSVSKYFIKFSEQIYNEFCINNDIDILKTNTVYKLDSVSTNKKYGFEPKFPIKIGTSILGVTYNEFAYLDLLRDGLNKPISFNLLGTCCPFKSSKTKKNTYLYKFSISFFDNKGKFHEEDIHFDKSDYEKPLILNGFSTIKITDSILKNKNSIFE